MSKLANGRTIEQDAEITNELVMAEQTLKLIQFIQDELKITDAKDSASNGNATQSMR